MTPPQDSNQQIVYLQQLMRNIDYGMLTTVDQDGSLHSRPMYINSSIDNNGILCFFTAASSHKVLEIEEHQQVNVSFSSVEKILFISISGKAKLVKDRKKNQDKWQPELTNWFPQGLDDPDLALLEINIDKAAYWDNISNFHPQIISL
ncbi:pyridoxamine 5'-phosphate oxidase family protein [Nostoc sp. TCL26-01]|uniref:pyridoxamine 5'-phosphate oxidase family protein n=1 Tax=Nostoc sp. TCL26-01 TaxID=2576904 RepID=UPI0015BB03D9|nr:pyridoxamine 5'-phosphate oxidase family protein [Nostoc sp. TCL26-01]QLE55508.1 pyridoxamine 5'-phosphate oxidase [Nostoc sp. TCL26-01]